MQLTDEGCVAKTNVSELVLKLVVSQKKIQWATLQEKPSLVEAYTKVVTAKQSIALAPIEVYKLDSLGLISYDRLSGHRGIVVSVAFSPDGQWIALLRGYQKIN